MGNQRAVVAYEITRLLLLDQRGMIYLTGRQLWPAGSDGETEANISHKIALQVLRVTIMCSRVAAAPATAPSGLATKFRHELTPACIQLSSLQDKDQSQPVKRQTDFS